MLRTVFSNFRYLAMAFVLFAALLFGLLLMSEYVFLEPYFVGHVPGGTELGLVLVVAIAALSAVVIPCNVFRVMVLRRSRHKMGGGIAGSVIGTVAGACSCGPAGFAIISTFGAAGATATAFLTAYEMPLRIAAVCILGLTYATTARSLRTECRIH